MDSNRETPLQSCPKFSSDLVNSFAAYLPTRDLDEWIERCESDRKAHDAFAIALARLAQLKHQKRPFEPRFPYAAPTHGFGRESLDLCVRVLFGTGRPPPPESAGKLRTEEERLAELVEILWADI